MGKRRKPLKARKPGRKAASVRPNGRPEVPLVAIEPPPDKTWKPEEWEVVRAYLMPDSQGKARTMAEAVAHVRPDLVNPRSKARRLLARAHIVDFIAKWRAYEVSELQWTRKRIIDSLLEVREIALGEARKAASAEAEILEDGTVVARPNPLELRGFVASLSLARTCLLDVAKLLGLDEPIKIEITTGPTKDQHNNALEMLRASVEAVKGK